MGDDPDPIAALTRVSFRYPSADDWALRNVDWSIARGSFTVVAGASGSGKSTLLRTLNGLVPQYSGGRFGGRVLVEGRDTRRHGPRDLAASVGFVFQDPEAQLVTTRVVDEIAFGPEQFGMDRTTLRVRVEESLDLVGIAHLRDREIATLSGGERQRVAIAAALALRPQILVLDEPTSQLDPWSAEELIAGLVRLNDDLGLTVVIAEHRLDRVAAGADELRFARPDGTWIAGAPRDVLVRSEVPSAMLPPVAALGRALAWAPLPLTVRDGRRLAALDHRSPSAPVGEPARSVGQAPVVTIDRLRLGHPSPGGAVEVLRRVDLTVGPGEIVALMGRNASGKTTLLRAIAGSLAPLAGTVSVSGKAIRAGGIGDGRVGYLPQDPGALLFSETVREELLASRQATTSRAATGALPDVDDLMVRLGLVEVAGRHPRSLSGGQRQRVAIGAVLASGPRVVLLDEPTRGMDGVRKAELAALLRDLTADGIVIIVATHDVELAAAAASRVVMLGGGEVIADGTTRSVLGDALSYGPQMSKVYGRAWLTVDEVLVGMGTDVTPAR